MKAIIELENKEIANQVVKAILNESYKWEEKREYYQKQYEKVYCLHIDEKRKNHRLEYYLRRTEECEKMSDKLWKIANSTMIF